jgi:hypothetical protein
MFLLLPPPNLTQVRYFANCHFCEKSDFCCEPKVLCDELK